MKIFLFVSAALLTGFIGTSTIDTMTRLKDIEKKQDLLLARVASSEETIVHFVNEANFEAQQAKAMAGNTNTLVRNITPTVGATEILVTGNIKTLHEQGQKLDAIKNFISLQSVTSSPSPTPSRPKYIPKAPIIGIDNSYEQRLKEIKESTATQALQGIRDELSRQRIDKTFEK